MHRDDDHFPFRKASRLINLAYTKPNGVAFTLTGYSLERKVLLWAIYRQVLRPGSTPTISMFALANSLRRPIETVRRQFGVLADQGFCRREGRQMRVVDDFLDQPRIVVAGQALAAICRELIASLRTMGFTLPEGVDSQPDHAMIAAILNIYLSAHELAEAIIHGPPARNLTTLYVVGAVTVHNVAALTGDPDLGERYGYDHTVPPDALRWPMSVRAIAAQDGMPYATVWRHVAAAGRDGLLQRTESGYLLSDFYMTSPQVSEQTRTKVRYVRRVLGDLAAGRLG